MTNEESNMKTWNIIMGGSGVDPIVVSAERLVLNESAARATFYVGEESVASFVGFSSVYPVTV